MVGDEEVRSWRLPENGEFKVNINASILIEFNYPQAKKTRIKNQNPDE